jgi:hypothetical protein
MSMRALTFKKIYNIFKGIASNHSQIGAVGFGEEVDINIRADENYPMLWLELPVPISQGGSGINNLTRWEISFRVVEIVEQSDYNESLANSLSKTEQIGQSIITTLMELKNCGYVLDYNWSAYNIFDSSNDNVEGWRFSTFLTSGRSVDNCDNFQFSADVCGFIDNC